MGINNPITPAQIGAVPIERILTAGDNMTGGGDLSANRTFNATGGGGSISGFANFTPGPAPGINRSINVASIAQTAAGRYRVTWTTPMSDDFYGLAFAGRFSDSANDLVPRISVDRRTGRGQVSTHVDLTVNIDTAVTSDGLSFISVIAFD